jgi:hypothetical protein
MIFSRRFALLAVLILILLESGLAAWWFISRTPSTAPVFSLPAAIARFDQAEGLTGALAKYRADRAAEIRFTIPDGGHLTVLYLEWDRIASGPAMGFAAHPAEECNTGLGYRFLGISPNRVYESPGGTALRFDCTRFVDLSGKPLFMFKIAWIQGVGAWQMRDEGQHRIERLRRSLVRRTGAARILQGGVFGARDADHAWRIFRERVLDQLVWR